MAAIGCMAIVAGLWAVLELDYETVSVGTTWRPGQVDIEYLPARAVGDR